MADGDTATIRYHDDSWEVPSGMSIRLAIEEIGLDPLAVLAIKGRKLVNHQVIVEPEDDIRLVDIVSGG